MGKQKLQQLLITTHVFRSEHHKNVTN